MDWLVKTIFHTASKSISTTRSNGGEVDNNNNDTNKLYNKQRILDDIFWETYNQNSRQNKFQFFLSFLSWSSILQYVVRTGTWYADRIAQSVVLYQGNDRAFWDFFLDHTNNIALVVLSFNICTIVLAIGTGFLRDYLNNSPENVRNVHWAMFGYVVVWLLMTILCWFYFFLRKYPTWCNRLNRMIKIDLFAMWGGIYRVTSMMRCLYFLYQVMILTLYMEDGMCYQTYSTNSQPTTATIENDPSIIVTQNMIFIAIISQITFDMYQVSLYSLIPFPWPWLTRLCIIQFLEAILRLTTCSKALNYLPMKDNIIYAVIVSLFFYYFIMTMYISNSFERSVRSAYFNIQDNKSAAQEKIHLVNMLSQHIKIPVQTLLQTFRNVQNDPQQDLATSLHIDSYIKQVYHSSSAMNQIVDDLLFLVKVEEKRFVYVCKDEIKLKACLQEVIEVIYFVLQLNEEDHQHGMKSRKFALFRYHEVTKKQAHSSKASGAKKILMDKSCTKVLLYYSILALLALLSQDKLEEVTAMLKEIPKELSEGCVDIFISEEDVDIRGDETKEKQLRIKVQADSFRQHLRKYKKTKDLPEAEVRWVRGGLLESTSLICQKIADSYGGHWDINEKQVEFTLYFTDIVQEEEGEEEDLEEVDEVRSRVEMKKVEVENDGGEIAEGDLETSRLMPKSKQKSSQHQQHRIKAAKIKAKQLSLNHLAMTMLSKQCYVYISEKHSESLLVAFIQSLFGEQSDVYLSRQLNVADLKVYTIVFVQSISACYQLRSLQFRGMIVLISEKLAYFDENELALFDYGLPWSYSSNELQTLIALLVSREQARHYQPHHQSHHGSLALSDASHSSTSSSIEKSGRPTDANHSISKDQSISNYYFIPPLHDCYDIYLRWRYVSPMNNAKHQSLMLEFVGVFAIICMTLQFVFKAVDINFYLSVNSILFMFAFRRVIHRYAWIEQTRLVLRRWLQACCFCTFLALFISLSSEFISYSNGMHVEKPERDSFVTFLEERHGGGYRGMHTLFFMINWPSYLKYFAEVVPWPLSPAIVVMLYLRVIILLFVFFRYFLLKETVLVIVVVTLCFALSVIMNAYHVEYLYRTGFRSVHELIMSRDFLDRCLQVTRWSLTQPLQLLEQIQVNFQAELHHKSTQQAIVVTSSLHQQMSQLHLNLFLSQEFLLYLKLSSMKLQPAMKTKLVSNMKAMMVKESVLKIASHFVIDTSDLSIKIYLCFHPRLTMVRMDEEILLTVLGSVLRSAVQRIQDRCNQDSHCAAYEHEIMIWIQPHELLQLASRPSPSLSNGGESTDDKRGSPLSNQPHPVKKVNSTPTLKFTDVRTALITVVDTGMLRGAEGDASPNTLANMLTGISSNKATDAFDHFSNRFLTLFNSPARYRTGPLCHHRYTTYQQCGVPYLLCPDSHKMTTLLALSKSNSSQIEQVINSKEASFRQYVKCYNEVMVEFSSQTVGISDEFTTKRLMELAKGSQMLQGNIHIVTNVNSLLSRYTGRNMELFQKLQWHCKTYHPRSLEKLASILQCEVLLIDVDCIITTQLPSKDNLNARNATTEDKQDLDIRDLLHFILAVGFQGSIFIVHSLSPATTSTDGEIIYGSTAYKLQHSNAYTDAFRVDMHVTAPFTKKSAKQILEKYESDFLSSL